nr:putative f-box/lrr-repeat protein [Quercus suber]
MSMERHVMDEKICAVDRISDLPEFILHHIFSLLYRKEAAKTGLLSKKWNCVWSSFPIFDFDQMHYFNLHSPCVPDTRPESQNRVEKFMNDVDKSISRFHVHQLPMQKFILNMTLFDFKLASLVDKWIGMALEHDVKEIDLQVAFSLEELKGITIPPSFELELNYDARSTNITTVHRNNRSWKSYRWLALELLSKKTVIANRFGVPRELHKGNRFAFERTGKRKSLEFVFGKAK